MPLQYTHFVQDFQGTPSVYDNRDDVDESKGYWQISSSGLASYVAGITNRTFKASDLSRFDNDLNQSQEPRRGLFGTPLFRETLIGDPLAGETNNIIGDLTQFPEIMGAFRRYLADKGLKGVTSGQGIYDVAVELNSTELLLYEDEDLLEQYWRVFSSGREITVELMAAFEGMVGGPRGTGEAIIRRAEGFATDTDSQGIPNAFDRDRDQDDPFTAGNAPVPGGVNETRPGAFPAGSTSLADAVNGGVDGAGGTAGDGLPGQTGTFDGMEVTPQLLREFVDSDWRLGFNAWMNTFRDAGAAGIFLNWMASQANRFIGEYEGRIGAQALAGEVPKGDFVSFLNTKGTGSGESLGGDPNAVSDRFSSFTAEEAAADAAGQQGPVVDDEELASISPATGDTDGTTLNELADPVEEMNSRVQA